MIALDTNLLVYAHRARTPEHARARKAIARAAGRPSTPSQAAAFVRALVRAGAQIWLPGPGFGDRLLQLATDLDVIGARVFDLQIALAAFEGGATDMWTHDGQFVTIPGLRLHDPL